MNLPPAVPSVRARLMVLLLKRRVKRRLAGAGVEEVRRIFSNPLFGAPRNVRVSPLSVGGVQGEWLQCDAPGHCTVLYIHGGAFIACSPRTHRAVTGGLARRGFRVFAPDYRLAPEHRFPAGLDDVLASYLALLDAGIRPDRLFVAGESAGGNLALALALRLRDERQPLPAGVAAFSPVTDLAGTGLSMRTNSRRDAMFDGSATEALAQVYLPPGTDPRTPLASPLHADLAGLPPILLHVGGDEVLRDDSIWLADRARAAGTEVELVVWRAVPHAWQLLKVVPEAGLSLDATAAFFRRHAA